MVMGRPNKGIDHVDSCDGSEQSKQRVQLILQTISGEQSVKETCERLGIQRPRFADLRTKALQAAVDALEPGRPGRPRKHDAEAVRREDELQRRIESLEKQLHVEQIRGAVSQILQRSEGGQKGAASKR